MPLKILYVVGTGSRNGDIELRWSLRSVEKFAQCDVEPVVVGSVPPWFKGEALPCEDEFERKEKNIGAKIMKAIDGRLVGGEFQISADDHFWLRAVDLSRLPIYFRQAILPEWTGQGNGYDKAMAGTRETLLRNGITAVNTTCHCNAWADAADVFWARALAERVIPGSLADKYGLVQWAVWPNLAMRRSTRPIVQRKDRKYRGEPDFGGFIDGAEMFSINDMAFGSNDFISFMHKSFGRKSRWER